MTEFTQTSHNKLFYYRKLNKIEFSVLQTDLSSFEIIHDCVTTTQNTHRIDYTGQTGMYTK
jgi:hypothetical protein